LPNAEPAGPAVRWKRRKVRRAVGGAASGAQSAWEAAQRAARATRSAGIPGREDTGRRGFGLVAPATFVNPEAIIPIAATTRKSTPKGTAQADIPAA